MSRIGKRAIIIPEGTKIEFNSNVLQVSGPLGTLSLNIDNNFKILINDNKFNLLIKNKKLYKKLNPLYGTTNALVNNIIKGVNKKFEKNLKLVGVGYRCMLKDNKINLKLGFSHEIFVDVPKDIDVIINKQTEINLKSISKQSVGDFAAKIRSYRPPEPYLGKGIRYLDEIIIKKEGKKAGK